MLTPPSGRTEGPAGECMSARRERLPGNRGAGRGRRVHARGDRREGGPGTLPFLAPHTHARARPEPSCPRRPGSPCGTGRRGPGSSGGSRSWPRAEDLPRPRPRRPARPRSGQSQGREAAAAAAAAAAAGEEAARAAAAAAAGWWPWRLGREGGRAGERRSWEAAAAPVPLPEGGPRDVVTGPADPQQPRK